MCHLSIFGHYPLLDRILSELFDIICRHCPDLVDVGGQYCWKTDRQRLFVYLSPKKMHSPASYSPLDNHSSHYVPPPTSPTPSVSLVYIPGYPLLTFLKRPSDSKNRSKRCYGLTNPETTAYLWMILSPLLSLCGGTNWTNLAQRYSPHHLIRNLTRLASMINRAPKHPFPRTEAEQMLYDDTEQGKSN